MSGSPTAYAREFIAVGRSSGPYLVKWLNALFHTSREDGNAISERLRLCRAVAGSRVRANEVSLHYTVSVGVSSMREDDRSVDAALGRADAALYRAKAACKNRICCETGDANEADPEEDERPESVLEEMCRSRPGRH